MSKRYLAALVATCLIGFAGLTGAAGAATPLPPPGDLAGAIVDGRASLSWSPVENSRDTVIYDVSNGQPGRVVGRSTTDEWVSINLPGRPSFSFQVVARDVRKQEGVRSDTITLYRGGRPTEPEPPTPPSEPETPPPPVEPTEPPPPTDPEEPPTEPEEPPTDPEEPPTDPTTPPAAVRDEPVDLGAAVSLARLQDPVYRETVVRYFDSITAENEMKARALQPQRGVFSFSSADQLVAFARENGKEVRGHTLFWHGANPSWISNGSFSQAEWAQLIRDHASNVVGHFAGDITSWDVLNEIVAEDGSGLRTDNPWVNGFGGDPLDAIALMFQAAHEADPAARLCINDFSVEFNRPKTEAYYRLVRDLLARGVPIDCVGFQSHLITESEGPGVSDPGGWSPTLGELTGVLQRFADLGVTVQLTEADLKTSPTPGTTEQKLAAHADMARVLAGACQAVQACTELTWWGVNDSQSWLGSGEMTLLFSDTVTDDAFTPKPAYWATRDILGGGPGGSPPVEAPAS
ncbi:endo-1,4-beta-xylanase [Blastococcus xanthinilyticus]|uniref:Beta-xylanase n=1 Tax=Blastococcus xanthinilyticus TaxID=1564164 RepID=A0A5S5CQ54_9ACTN|nr:endo-1,4-beta-xylanase [Blastococcus xanthinilyticus]TYP82019.1 GH35 family endo-1,4-beta-xylanase [Blastococcus xanthinilyticus]